MVVDTVKNYFLVVEMKLLYCLKCQGVVRLTLDNRGCECGNAKGRYTDNINAIYSEKEVDTVIPFGIANSEFKNAILNRKFGAKSYDKGLMFESWTMSKDVKVFKKVEEEKL